MKKLLLIICLSALFLTGCATTLTTTVQRPAELNLNGAQSISVLPFQTRNYDDDYIFNIKSLIKEIFATGRNDSQKQIASYLTNEITEELLDSGFMEVIGSRRVQRAIEDYTTIPCDVYLTGYITDYHDDIDANWNETDEVYEFVRKVELKIVYEVIDSESNRVISRKSKNISQTSDTELDDRDLPTAYEMVRSDLDSLVKTIMKQLQPYEVLKLLTLYDDKTKLEEMKIAKNLAKDGYIDTAQEMYETIYNEKGIFEAGYNAAILLQAQGYLEEAEELMKKVYIRSGNSKASSALNDIRQEIKYAGKLKDQLDQKNYR